MNNIMNELAVNAPIFEIKLTNGQTIVGEVVDHDTDDTTFMVYDPLRIDTIEGRQYIAKWFYSAKDPFIQLEKSQILAYAECDDYMKTKYVETSLRLAGVVKKEEEEKPLLDDSNILYH